MPTTSSEADTGSTDSPNHIGCTPTECAVPEHRPGHHGPRTRYAEGRTKWSCAAFLNEIRGETDRLANNSFQALLDLDEPDVAALFARMDAQDSPNPSSVPAASHGTHLPDRTPLEAQIDEQAQNLLNLKVNDPRTGAPIPSLDLILRGQEVFWDHAELVLVVLIFRSLPEGYAGPNYVKVLHRTQKLEDHTYRRLIETLQAVTDVTSRHGFESDRLGLRSTGSEALPSPAKAISTAKKLRLGHAMMRRVVTQQSRTGHLQHFPPPMKASELADYESKYGRPLNLEQMLGTLMALSYVVIEGLSQLDAPLSDADAQAYYHIWMVFGVLMGIHPPGNPGSTDYVPQNVAEAKEFYEAHKKRYYVGEGTLQPDVPNEAGKRLAKAHVESVQRNLAETLPEVLRTSRSAVGRLAGALLWFVSLFLNERRLVIYAMQRFMGSEGCARLGLPSRRPNRLYRRLLEEAKWADEVITGKWVRQILAHLIRKEIGGEGVTFVTPAKVADLRGEITLKKRRKTDNDRRKGGRRTSTGPIDFADRRSGVDRRKGDRRAISA